jgi:hypothetical protein
MMSGIRKCVPQNSESGQTIILMAALMIGLLGMLGLAIDGGRLFFVRRDSQNAVDSAIMAASYALCTGGDPEAAAHKAIRDNGFIHNGDDVRVVVAYPPIRDFSELEAAGITIDLQYYIDVYLTVRIEPYFIQFVYDGPLEMTTDGVGYCQPSFDPTGVPAVWAGSLTCDTCGDNPSGNSILNWTGSQSEFFSEGELFFSNGNIFLNGSEAQPSEVTGGISAYCEAGFSGTNDFEYEAGAEPVIEPPVPYRIEDFAPGGYFAERALYDPEYGEYYAITPATVAANPGVEPYSWVAPNGEFVPNGVLEGLYYVEYPVLLSPAKAEVGDHDAGWKGVSIASTEDISMVNAIGPLWYYIGGILFYTDYNPGPIGCNASETGLTVSGFSEIHGCAIAPWSGIQFSANSTYVEGCLIGQFVWMNGADMYFYYNPSMLEAIPSSIGVAD